MGACNWDVLTEIVGLRYSEVGIFEIMNAGSLSCCVEIEIVFGFRWWMKCASLVSW